MPYRMHDDILFCFDPDTNYPILRVRLMTRLQLSREADVETTDIALSVKSYPLSDERFCITVKGNGWERHERNIPDSLNRALKVLEEGIVDGASLDIYRNIARLGDGELVFHPEVNANGLPLPGAFVNISSLVAYADWKINLDLKGQTDLYDRMREIPEHIRESIQEGRRGGLESI